MIIRSALAAALVGLASAAAAQSTIVSTAAGTTGTIQPGGPRQGVNGDRFFNVEGLNNGAFASYGVARWDLSTARAALDTAFGAGQWQVTGLELELTQDNAAFSAAGPVRVYYSTDDQVDIKTLGSPLTYPLFDPVTQAPDMALGNGGIPILSYGFVVIGTGTLDRYTQTGSFQNGAPLNPAESLSLAPDVVQDIITSNTLTLVFEDADFATTATYRGQEAFQGRVGPNLFIKAEAKSVACYADCNGDGQLNLSDFGCFQTRFALGEPYADCNGDGVRNLSDFGCFQTKFALGCP